MTRGLYLALALVTVVCLATVATTDNLSQFGGSPEGDRLTIMKQSSHFDGKRFRNPVPTQVAPSWSQSWDMTRRYLFGAETRVPKDGLPVAPLAPSAFASPPAAGLRVTWLGHATTLIELDGKRILTDPVWSERCSPSSLIGPARFHAPPLALEDLPPLDAVIISHDHYDHLDKAAIDALAPSGVRFFVPLGVGAHLQRWGVDPAQVVELDWWQHGEAGDLRIVATPARHFSGRGLFDRDTTLWASWAMVGPEHRVFFSGDTGPFPGFEEIGTELGPFDLTLIKVGAYDRTWPAVHLNPEQAVDAHLALQGDLLLPIHWGTFNLAIHDWFEPPERLLRAVRGLDIRLALPRPGESVVPENVGPGWVDFWWRKGLRGGPGWAAADAALALPSGEPDQR